MKVTRDGSISKYVCEAIEVRPGFGVAGDIHAGRSPDRALSLMRQEWLDEFAASGLAVPAGAIGENVLLRGFEPHVLAEGVRLRLGPMRSSRSAARAPRAGNWRASRPGCCVRPSAAAASSRACWQAAWCARATASRCSQRGRPVRKPRAALRTWPGPKVWRTEAFDNPTAISDEEVYAVVAWILNQHGMLENSAVLDADTVMQMNELPNFESFFSCYPEACRLEPELTGE